MKSLFSKLFLALLTTLLTVGCAALKTTQASSSNAIQATIDLVSIEEDKVEITLVPPQIKTASTVFYLPQIVPGTYEYSNFGRFVEEIQAFDNKGNRMELISLDENSWEIVKPKKTG